MNTPLRQEHADLQNVELRFEASHRRGGLLLPAAAPSDAARLGFQSLKRHPLVLPNGRLHSRPPRGLKESRCCRDARASLDFAVRCLTLFGAPYKALY